MGIWQYGNETDPAAYVARVVGTNSEILVEPQLFERFEVDLLRTHQNSVLVCDSLSDWIIAWERGREGEKC